MGWYLSYFLFLLSEGRIGIGCEWVGRWSDGGRKWDVAACACALGHASSCDEGGCVGCMGDDVVGRCSGGVELKGEWTQMWTCANFQLTGLTCSHRHTEPTLCRALVV